MKKILSRLTAIIVCAILLAGTLPCASAADSIAVMLDGKPLRFTTASGQPLLRNGRTYVPFRAIFEGMGAVVGWDKATHTVSAVRNGTTVSMVLGKQTITITEQGEQRTAVTDAKSFLEKGRTYVPVRFAAQAFGANVGWDAALRTVVIVDAVKHGTANPADFRIMNRFLALIAPNESRTISGTLALTYTVHTADGDAATPITLQYSGTRDKESEVLHVQTTAGLSAITAALAKNPKAVSEKVRNLLGTLQHETFSCIISRPDSALYLQGQLQSYGVPQNAWVRLPLDGALRALSSDTLTEYALAGLLHHDFIQYTTGQASANIITSAAADNTADFSTALETLRAPFRDRAFSVIDGQLGVQQNQTTADGATDIQKLLLTTDADGNFTHATKIHTVTKGNVTLLDSIVLYQLSELTAKLNVNSPSYTLSATLTETSAPSAQTPMRRPSGTVVPNR